MTLGERERERAREGRTILLVNIAFLQLHFAYQQLAHSNSFVTVAARKGWRERRDI